MCFVQSSSDELVPERLYTKVNIKVRRAIRCSRVSGVVCVAGERSRLCCVGQLLSLCNNCREGTGNKRRRKVKQMVYSCSIPPLLTFVFTCV